MVRLALLLGLLVEACAAVDGASPGPASRDLAASPAPDDLAATGPHDLAGLRLDDGGLPIVGDLATIVDLATGCGAAEHLVINEVKTSGSTPTGANDEFIELYNPCARPVPLGGWSLLYRSSTGTSDVVIVNFTKTVDGGGYFLIAGPTYSGAAPADQTYGGGRLAAAGGAVALRDATQLRVDSVGYGTATNAFVEGAAAAAPAADQSIARRPNGSDTNHNEVDFAVATTPTPKAAN